MTPEKHEILKEREEKLKEKFITLIYNFEKHAGVWVKHFKYHKNCRECILEITTGLELD